jgi:hypothetical protein
MIYKNWKPNQILNATYTPTFKRIHYLILIFEMYKMGLTFSSYLSVVPVPLTPSLCSKIGSIEHYWFFFIGKVIFACFKVEMVGNKTLFFSSILYIIFHFRYDLLTRKEKKQTSFLGFFWLLLLWWDSKGPGVLKWTSCMWQQHFTYKNSEPEGP